MNTKVPVAIVSRIFNIAPSQWARVNECWFLTFFFKIGSAIGGTVLIATFVSRFGISFLPMLFVINAVLIMLSTFFFEQLIMRFKREVLMIIMILLASLCLFFASFMYDRSPFLFFTLIIVAESVFLAQFNVFLPILVGDRFSPTESQNTFPFIESGETIGGIVGGTLVGVFASRFPIHWFLYVWIAFLTCVVIVFIVTSYIRMGIPALPLPVKSSTREKTTDQIKLIFKSIDKFAYLKGIIVVVLLQWVFMNVLEFQYTKAVEQDVTTHHEETVAALHPKLFAASVMSSDEGIKNMPQVEQEVAPYRALTQSEERALTEKLGAIKGIIHASALVIQVFLASRLIASLGIVGSMLLNPVLMLMSLVGMFLKFGFASAIITRINFEASNVVHKNAYFTSHYAFPKSIRDQAAEFLEGMVRPMGTIVGMIVILTMQLFLTGAVLTLWIHVLMFIVMAIVLVVTIRLQPKYTALSRDQLFSHLPYPEKLNAIEILAQRGHDDVSTILVQKLNNARGESPIVKIKLLEVLGHLHDYNTLPEIVEALYDPDPEVRLEAAHALMRFRDIGEKFYAQAFSRFRIIEALKEVFRKEESPAVRSAIIRVFSLLRQPDIVAFLLETLKDTSSEVRADGIHTLGLFHDPNAAYYILPFLEDAHPMVRASAVTALWQFFKYRAMLEKELAELLTSGDKEEVKAGIFAVGEVGGIHKKPFLDIASANDPVLAIEVSYAMTKQGDAHAFRKVLTHLLAIPREQFENLRRLFFHFQPHVEKMVDDVLIDVISEELNMLLERYAGKSLQELSPEILERLRRLYKILDQHEELFLIEEALQRLLK